MTKLVLSQSARKPEATMEIKLSGSQEFLDRVLWHLKSIEHMGAVGHSTMLGIDVDGDGADFVKVECSDWDKEKGKTLNAQANAVDSGDVEVFTPRAARRVYTKKTETVWPKESE